MANISQKLIDVIEELDWNIDEGTYGDGTPYLELESWSNAGEDFILTLDATDDEKLVQSLYEYIEDFDPEEHASGWYGKNNGEPSSIKALLEDAEYILHEMLEPLEKALRATLEGKDWHEQEQDAETLKVYTELSDMSDDDLFRAVPQDVQDRIYEHIRRQYAKEDIEGWLEDQDYDLDDIDGKEIDDAVDVLRNHFDCENSYWGNVQAAVDACIELE